MGEQVENYNVWLDSLINKITTNLSKDFHHARYEASVPGDSFFISDMLFVSITANSNNKDTGKKNTISVVVKKPPVSDAVRDVLRIDQQFHNEILFYKRYGKDYEEFPRCIYTEEKPPIGSVIVLENVVIQRGYELCKWKYDVPLEYTLAAFREIARFHANAYVMKEQRREKFFDFVKDIQEPRYYPESNLKVVINVTATRSIEYLRKQGYDERICDKLEAQLEDTYGNVIMKAIEPEEPLAVLCHGDFTINNTLFKRENGELKAMFIDFALMRYSTPILDLSTFLCLHCSKDLDKNMLDNVLKVYHDALTQILRKNGVDCEKYSYEAFYEDYKKKGLIGFFIATFFLSMMMGKNDKDVEDLMGMDQNESAAVLRQAGGDEISEILANMLLNLKEFGCLDHIP